MRQRLIPLVLQRRHLSPWQQHYQMLLLNPGFIFWEQWRQQVAIFWITAWKSNCTISFIVITLFLKNVPHSPHDALAPDVRMLQALEYPGRSSSVGFWGWNGRNSASWERWRSGQCSGGVVRGCLTPALLFLRGALGWRHLRLGLRGWAQTNSTLQLCHEWGAQIPGGNRALGVYIKAELAWILGGLCIWAPKDVERLPTGFFWMWTRNYFKGLHRVWGTHCCPWALPDPPRLPSLLTSIGNDPSAPKAIINGFPIRISGEFVYLIGPPRRKIEDSCASHSEFFISGAFCQEPDTP